MSSVTNETWRPASFARRTERTEAATTSSGLILSLYLRWTLLAATKMAMWVTPLSITASTSAGTVRAAASTFDLRPAVASSRTARASSGETTGIPALRTPTPMPASFSAMRSFSSGVNRTPGVCSPSRSVSSQMTIDSGRWRSRAVSEW